MSIIEERRMLKVEVLPQLKLEVRRLRDLCHANRMTWVIEGVLVPFRFQGVPKRYSTVHILLSFPLVVAQPSTVLACIQGICDVKQDNFRELELGGVLNKHLIHAVEKLNEDRAPLVIPVIFIEVP